MFCGLLGEEERTRFRKKKKKKKNSSRPHFWDKRVF